MGLCWPVPRSSELERTSQPMQVKDEETELRREGVRRAACSCPHGPVSTWADRLASEVRARALEPGTRVRLSQARLSSCVLRTAHSAALCLSFPPYKVGDEDACRTGALIVVGFKRPTYKALSTALAVSVSASVIIPSSGLDLRTAEVSAPGEVLQVDRPSPEHLSGTGTQGVGLVWRQGREPLSEPHSLVCDSCGVR